MFLGKGLFPIDKVKAPPPFPTFRFACIYNRM